MTGYEQRKAVLMHALEGYRNALPENASRCFIDDLIKVSRKAAECDPEDKKLHNLIVLKYLTDKRLSRTKMCEILHTSRDKKLFAKTTERAIDRLMVLAFGVEGVNWDEE